MIVNAHDEEVSWNKGTANDNNQLSGLQMSTPFAQVVGGLIKSFGVCGLFQPHMKGKEWN